MVFFSCDSCQASMKKAPMLAHVSKKCSGTTVSCVDCSTTFTGNSFDKHNACITEAEKFEKKSQRYFSTPASNPTPVAEDPKKRKLKETPEEPAFSKKILNLHRLLSRMKKTKKSVSLKEFRRDVKKHYRPSWKFWKALEETMTITFDEASGCAILKAHLPFPKSQDLELEEQS